MADYNTDERIAYAVVDIETTGLSADSDVPLEFGIALIDVNGLVIEEESWLIHNRGDSFYADAIKRGKAHPLVGPMHEKSNLWTDLDETVTTTVSNADHEIVLWMEDMGAPRNLGMMGNSVGSLDRPFVLNWFPQVNSYLGYRNIDMSSLKELVKRTNPVLWEQIEPMVGDKSQASHRVLGDIQACIEEYRVYLREFLITGDVVDL